jgi:hypothetical protein
MVYIVYYRADQINALGVEGRSCVSMIDPTARCGRVSRSRTLSHTRIKARDLDETEQLSETCRYWTSVALSKCAQFASPRVDVDQGAAGVARDVGATRGSNTGTEKYNERHKLNSFQ